ncbi:MAG: septum formation initiator [Alphaproteobacteria bacterium PA4]|nr:MAG: septum formation initiator [Alphaproteobacteria bacterium PA4]
MELRNRLAPYIGRALVPMVCLVLIVFFVARTLTGPTGVFAWGDYRRERLALEQQKAANGELRVALQKRIDLLDPKGVDRDMADELVRKNMKFIRKDEVIVPLPDTKPNQ